jgi:hypothetical protein
MTLFAGRVEDRDIAVACFVSIPDLDDHAIERVLGAAAGVALHEAAWDEPVLVREGEHGAAEVLLHGGAAAVRAVLMLPVDRLRLLVLFGQHIRLPLDGFPCDLGVELDEADGDPFCVHARSVGLA